MDERAIVFTVREFCAYAHISVSKIYALWAIGQGPRVVRIGRRVFISRETGEAWLKSLEEVA